MPQVKRLILPAACFASVALSALLVSQSAGVVPPAGVGWGDGTRGRAYSVEVQGPIVVRTASGMTRGPPGSYAYAVQSLARSNGFGVSYHRWNMTAGRAPQAPVLGSFAEVRVGPAWPIAVSLALVLFWGVLAAGHRRAAGGGNRCPDCGYDLRATPARCPECGSVPAARPAA